MNDPVKNLRFIQNKTKPKNFKEYGYLLELCMQEEERIIHARQKLTTELREVRKLKKHLLKNPVTNPTLKEEPVVEKEEE